MEQKRRNATVAYIDNPVGFMQQHTMTADFTKGLQDNYLVRTDPNLRRKVPDQMRSWDEKLFGKNKTKPVSETDQRKLILDKANRVVSESGLKTHFFKVMEDREREGVFNLTPDVESYRAKYAQKQKKYAALEGVSEKQQKKLDALKAIVDVFEPISPRNEEIHPADSSHMQAGYFPYKPQIGDSGDQVGNAPLESKKSATGRWLFTGQMNGCALAIEHTMKQRQDKVEVHGKVSHFPSPSSNLEILKQWIPNQQSMTGWFGFDGYTGGGDQVDAFNAVHVQDGVGVHVFSQQQTRAGNATTATGQVNVFAVGNAPLSGELRAQIASEAGATSVVGMK